MKDRVSKYPGRVIITPTGKANEYDIVRADEPTEPGSAYNKGNVLPDEVCTMLGIDADTSEPKDAFAHTFTTAEARMQTFRMTTFERVMYWGR